MEYRKATIDDLDDLTILLNDFENYNFSHHDPDPDEISTLPELKEILRKYFKSPRTAVFIAKDESKPVGYAHVYHDDHGDTCVLDDIYVIDEYRKKGVGKVLLDMVEEWAKERSESIKLEVFDWNKSAQEFYKRHNYEMDSIVYIKWF